jgi:YtkA-like
VNPSPFPPERPDLVSARSKCAQSTISVFPARHALSRWPATKGLSMIRNHCLVRAAAFASAFAFVTLPTNAATTDYRFELVGKPQLSGRNDIVQVRLVHAADGKPVSDAVIFESKVDMGPAGMDTMTAPVKPLPAKGGIYSFEVEPGMAGTWALHLAAKVQGEPDTVRGTLNVDLVK